MSGKPKKTKAPAAEEPIDDEFPVDDIEERPIETADISEAPKSTTKGKAPADAKKKKGGRKFRLSSIDPIILASFSVFMVACLIVTGITIYDITAGETSTKAAEYGDSIEIRYTGSYNNYYTEEGAVIFDTNMSDVGEAIKEGTYKHSSEYTQKDEYSLLDFTIGQGGTATGFDVEFIGKTPGESFRFYIDDGYGSLTEGVNKFNHAKANIELNREQIFTNNDYLTFFGVDEVPKAPMYEVDTPYGWKADVSPITGDMIKVCYNPEETKTYNEDSDVKIKVNTVTATTINYDYVADDFEYNTKIVKTAFENTNVYVICSNGADMTYKTTDEKTGTRMFFVVTFVDYSS